MTDIYQLLARHLDRLPAGLPATETGVELRILKRLFTAEEARIAMGLTMMLEPVSAIARRLGVEAKDLQPALDQMSRKGLIFRSTKQGQTLYMAAQFVVGIWEYHVNDLDEELIKDFNEYVPHLIQRSWVERKTKQLRVIPVSASIRADMQVMPYEEAEEIIRRQSKIVVAPCICRREHRMAGAGCDKPMEVCLLFGSGAYFYEQNGLGRPVSSDEALTILDRAMEAGLVLQPGNAQKPSNICMCCGCCCQILKNLNNLEKPALAVDSNYYAEVNPAICNGCGVCETRCQMGAIELREIARILPERCIGCGLCIPTCEEQAIRLTAKDADRQIVPPKNLVDTYLQLARERGLIK
ncbi:MAG: 4Fe-4S ferredoxin [Deltaproteobacteria bacterium SG8_13]|nr:MAG: 4Fe-4S ferredoxin [Deltaproteobacteria bacterium SG8_13]